MRRCRFLTRRLGYSITGIFGRYLVSKRLCGVGAAFILLWQTAFSSSIHHVCCILSVRPLSTFTNIFNNIRPSVGLWTFPWSALPHLLLQSPVAYGVETPFWACFPSLTLLWLDVVLLTEFRRCHPTALSSSPTYRFGHTS